MATIRYIVTVTIIPLKGCQKYGLEILNQFGSNGAFVVKYGINDFWIKESMINKLSEKANLKEKRNQIIKGCYWKSFLTSIVLIHYDTKNKSSYSFIFFTFINQIF